LNVNAPRPAVTPIPEVETAEEDDDPPDGQPGHLVIAGRDDVADDAAQSAWFRATRFWRTPASGGEDGEDALVLPQVHVAAVEPPGEAGLVIGLMGDGATARVDCVGDVAVWWFAAVGGCRRARLGDHHGDEVHTPAVAGHRHDFNGGVGLVGQRGGGRGGGADVTRRGAVAIRLEPTGHPVVDGQPSAGERDDDQPSEEDQ
jgi:hypothetical protein